MKRALSKTTNSSRSPFFVSLMQIVIFALFICSCSSNDKQSPVVSNIPKEIRDLIYFKGDENAPIVLINVQRGPDTVLSTVEVDFFVKNFNTTDILTVNVYQEQTLNPDILNDEDITLDQAIAINAKSIEKLYQVIKYFKDEGKKIYVLGIAYGAFMVQELIVKKGMDVADKYLIMTGRLDVNDIMWQAYAEGRYGFFENGITPVPDSDPDRNMTDRNLARIAAAIVMNRYTRLLDPFGDLSKITYVYGTTDEVVGSLLAEEVQFLESKNVNIIVGSGNHDRTISEFLRQDFNEAFELE